MNVAKVRMVRGFGAFKKFFHSLEEKIAFSSG
jgi:hypothetical protein